MSAVRCAALARRTVLTWYIIQVYYDPQKPEYVSGATKGMSMLEIGFGALCLLGAVFLGIRTMRQR